MKNFTAVIDYWLALMTESWSVDERFSPAWTSEKKADWIIANASTAKILAFKRRGVGQDTWEQYLNNYGLTETYSITKVS